MSDYPEHDKLGLIAPVSQVIGEFLDDGLREQGLVLARWYHCEDGEDRLIPDYTSIDRILAKYFDIDPDKIEAEKRQMLAALRGEIDGE